MVQKWPSFQKFFLATIGQENFFYDILKRKNTFLGYKNKNFKKSKNWHFSKGDNPRLLVQKCLFLQHFFFRQYGQGNVCYDIVERKIAFQGYKNKTFKKGHDIFQKGLTHVFGPKMAIFPTFFFRQYRPEKYLLRYSRTKNRLSRL